MGDQLKNELTWWENSMNRDVGDFPDTTTETDIKERVETKARWSQILPDLKSGQCADVALGLAGPKREEHKRNPRTDNCSCGKDWFSFVLDSVCCDNDTEQKHVRDPNEPSKCVCGGRFSTFMAKGGSKTVFYARRTTDNVPKYVAKFTWGGGGSHA